MQLDSYSHFELTISNIMERAMWLKLLCVIGFIKPKINEWHWEHKQEYYTQILVEGT